MTKLKTLRFRWLLFTRDLGLSTNKISIGYDPIGQLTSWSGTESSGELRHNEQLAYAFDAVGNLHTRTNDALVQTFTVDPHMGSVKNGA
jgi:hypothetical protein